MLQGLNTSWWMVAAYVAVAAIAAWAGTRERRALSRLDLDLLPVFWLLTAILFSTMAAAHAGDYGDSLADFGRRHADRGGWYEARRSAQTWAVGAVGAVWTVTTFLTIWRFDERRRRYLSTTLVVVSLLCFSAIRLVSLHAVDTLLYRRDIEGARIGVLVEMSLLAIAAATVMWSQRRRILPVRAEVLYDVAP